MEDDVLILAASWEERCLSVPKRLASYRCEKILMSIYDGPSQLRQKNIEALEEILPKFGELNKLNARHANPLPNVRDTIAKIRELSGKAQPRISMDISTFTRKHLLQLLQGLDQVGMLNACQLFYTEQEDYHTEDDEPIAQGITSVKAIETFAGHNNPSRDSLLIIFLGYEGTRAQALWEHIEPNITLAVIPDPPYKSEWHDRTEAQNRYLLSCLPKDHILKCHSMCPADTVRLLTELTTSNTYSADNYNYRIAPLGTKAQTLGVYRFWQKHRGMPTVMYASPVRYKEERATFPPGRTWLLDKSTVWSNAAV